jgi:hypothetical protein
MEHKASSTNGAESNGNPEPVGSHPHASKQRVTVALPVPLVEGLRNVVYWTGHHTLAQIIVDSLEDTLAAIEHANGGPFPARPGPLKSGRRPRKPPPSHISATEYSSGACVTR